MGFWSSLYAYTRYRVQETLRPARYRAGSLARAMGRLARDVFTSERGLLGRPLAEDNHYLSGVQLLDEDPHPSEVLDQHDNGPYLGHYFGEMMRHPEIRAAFNRRRTAVLSLPRFLVAANDQPKARTAFEFARAALAAVPSFQLHLGHQHDAVPYGLAVDEILYERLPRGPLRDAIVPVDMIDRPMHRFGFRKGVLHLRSGDGLTLDPTPPHPMRFLVNRHGTKDSPWGDPLLDCLADEYHYSKQGRIDYATAIAKWAQPVLYMHYEELENNDKENLRRVHEITKTIRDMTSKTGLALPNYMRPDTIEPKRNTPISYTAFLNVARMRIFLIVCGETGETSGASDSGPGSYAKLKVIAEGAVAELIGCDAHWLGTHLTDNFLRPLIALNLGLDYLPYAPRYFIDPSGEGDIEMRQKGLQLLLDENEKRRARKEKPVPIPVREIYQTTRVRAPAQGEETLDQDAPEPNNDDATAKEAA